MTKTSTILFRDIMGIVSLVIGIVILIVLLIVLLGFSKLLTFFVSLSSTYQILLSAFCVGGVFVFVVVIAIIAVVLKALKR